jgi:hypothetical protein
MDMMDISFFLFAVSQRGYALGNPYEQQKMQTGKTLQFSVRTRLRSDTLGDRRRIKMGG